MGWDELTQEGSREQVRTGQELISTPLEQASCPWLPVQPMLLPVVVVQMSLEGKVVPSFNDRPGLSGPDSGSRI